MPEMRPPLWKTLTRAIILVGLVSMLIALAVFNILEDATFRSSVVLGPLAAGALLFVIGILSNLGWMRERFVQRKFLVGLNVWAMVFLSLVLLLVANAIVAGTPQTDAWFVDCTQERIYTLSQKTRNILRDLDQDVQITVLMGTGHVPYGLQGSIEVGPKVRDLIRLYRGGSSNVETEVIDVYRQKTRAEQLAIALKTEVKPDSIIVQCGDRHKQVAFADLIDFPRMPYLGADQMPLPGFKGEEKLTEAVLSVAEESQTTVYFTTGHGELATEGAEGKAFNQFVIELKRDNYRVDSLNLMTQREIPEDCDLIVIPGPTAPFQNEEVDLLRTYLKKNGKLLVFLRPRATRGNAAGLDALLAEYNVVLRDDQVIIEVYRNLFTGRQVGDLQVIVDDYGEHPITEDLKTTNCVVQSTCFLEPAIADDASGVAPSLSAPYKTTPLMRSSPRSWGESNLAARNVQYDQGQDTKGPLILAMAIEPKGPRQSPYAPQPPGEDEKGPRIVVVGSITVASDTAIREYAGNRTFALNCVGWLARKESKLGIPPQRPQRHELDSSPTAMRATFFITVLGMPLAAAIAGGLVWWIRRRW